MVTKPNIIPRNSIKNPVWNIFDVYPDMPRSKQATMEMKALCDRFVSDYIRLANKYSKEGLADSASRDMTIRYLLEKLEPWRKKWRTDSELSQVKGKMVTRSYRK